MILTQEQTHKVTFMNDSLTPFEANDFVTTVIDKYINFHKLLYMQRWERNHETDLQQYDQRIKALEEKKQLLKGAIAEAQREGTNVSIDGIFELKVA